MHSSPCWFQVPPVWFQIPTVDAYHILLELSFVAEAQFPPVDAQFPPGDAQFPDTLLYPWYWHVSL
jgi:hypothetical protein